MTHVNELLYEIHTNNEASLMREGKKPFAVFSRHVSEKIDLDFLTDGQDFGIANIQFEEWQHGDSVYYMFHMRGEEWRVSAYKLVCETIHEVGYVPQLEWVEGRLLGYTQAQCKEFIKAYPMERYNKVLESAKKEKSI